MSKLAKRISAIVAILLSICLVFALLGFVGCGNSEDDETPGSGEGGGTTEGGTTEGGTTEDEDLEFASFYAETTFGVAFIVGASFNISNVNVYGVWADDGTSTCISGMRADSAYSDTVVMIDADGKETDAIEITSDEMTITLKYTGTKYTVSEESARTFTFTLSASYADKAEVYPYTLGMNDAISSYAGLGDGADAMCVAVYYTAYSSWSGEEEQSYDTHGDCTITITNASGGNTLALGENTITATTVCKGWDDTEKKSVDLTIDTITVTISANRFATDASDPDIIDCVVKDSSNNVIDSYTLEKVTDEETQATSWEYQVAYLDGVKFETEDTYMYMGFLEIKDIDITFKNDGTAVLNCDLMEGYTGVSYSINGDTITVSIPYLGGDGIGTITYDEDGTITQIVFSSFGGTEFETGSEMNFTPAST